MKKIIVALLALCMMLSAALAVEGDAISLCGYHDDTTSQ